MGLGRGAGGQEEQSGQGGCGDLHGAAEQRGRRAGLELGAAGRSAAGCCLAGAMPCFYARPLGGRRVSQNPP